LSFNSFAFHPQIHAGIIAAGYESPTPIQKQTIPPILAGRDVLGLAQTGTGKTAAFVLPILQRLLQGGRRKPRALILSPTRELAEQTHRAIQALGKQTGLRSVSVYGGVSPSSQVNALRAGADFIVACPGRLLDLHGQQLVSLDTIEVVVLDEADRMFDMGFLPDVRRILAALPAKRQTLLFSATMPPEIRSLADDLLHNPATAEISISRPLETVSHAAYRVEQTQKPEALLRLLGEAKGGQVLVFTRTKHRAKKIAQKLVQAGLPAVSLQGNLSQNARQAAMDSFREGRAKIMVATDIASRGIDVSQITLVVNFDLPDTSEAYTHRTGRTGRMERLGMAISLVTPDDEPMLRTIERQLGFPMEHRQLISLAAAAEVTVARVQAPVQRAEPQAAAKHTPSNWRSRRPVNRSRPFPAFRPTNARE
jgi:ATP-dependent RNA helicase RhlE